MDTVHTVAGLREQLRQWRQAGQRIGLVPTMGNLHDGHLQLVARAGGACDRIVTSIFVNPLQFGPSEDFERYPRTLEADADKLRAAGCDLLFAPDVAEMYPNGREQMSEVRVPALSDVLEGAFRPGHFTGVATVVSLLFNQVQPDVAVFGEKDWQQLQVIRRMVADLHMPIEILGHPTAREADGLALSSRNQYLSAAQRKCAPALSRVLEQVAAGLRAGQRDFEALQNNAIRDLVDAGFRPQYVEIRSPELSVTSKDARSWVVVAAAFLGDTRLIDNIKVEL